MKTKETKGAKKVKKITSGLAWHNEMKEKDKEKVIEDEEKEVKERNQKTKETEGRM